MTGNSSKKCLLRESVAAANRSNAFCESILEWNAEPFSKHFRQRAVISSSGNWSFFNCN